VWQAGDRELQVVVTDDYLRPEVRTYCAGRDSVLLVRMVGQQVWIGPLMQAARSTCYDCLTFYLVLHAANHAQPCEFTEAAEEIRIDRKQRLSASGKGRSPQEARRVLTLEAAERYSTLYDATERLLLGTVAKRSAFPLDSILLLSPAQNAVRTEGVSALHPA